MKQYLSEWAPFLLMWVVIIFALFAIYFRKRFRQNHSGRSKRAVTAQLRSRGRLLEWKVLTDVELRDDRGGAAADQLVVGPFGVLIVCDADIPGNYYGDPSSPYWIVSEADQDMPEAPRRKVENPMLRCQDAEAAARRILAKGGVYNMMIESVVVAAGKDMQICINGGRDRILNKSQFGAFLSQARFGTDNGVDVDKVAGLLTGA